MLGQLASKARLGHCASGIENLRYLLQMQVLFWMGLHEKLIVIQARAI
jgi:hypothetical protein